MGTSECGDPTLREHHIITGSGISSSSGLFFLNAEFAESADENIFAGFQCVLNLFKQNLNQFGGSVFRKSEIFVNRINNVCFCQSHGSVAPVRQKGAPV